MRAGTHASPEDDCVEREVRLARVDALRAALAAIEGWPRAETAALVQHGDELQLCRAEEDLTTSDATTTDAPTSTGASAAGADAAVVRAATGAQRARLIVADRTVPAERNNSAMRRDLARMM